MPNKQAEKWTPAARNETRNSEPRRRAQGFYERYFIGKGIDVGCGKETVVPDCDGWDIARGDGDATYMSGVANESYDFVYASHVLEHLESPQIAVDNWWRILKPGGHLIIAVPDEDLYEQGMWPSRFNSDHRTRWTAHKDGDAGALNLVDMVKGLENHKVVRMQICDDRYDHSLRGVDQPTAERQVEIVVQKTAPEEWMSFIWKRVRCSCGKEDLLMKAFMNDLSILTQCVSCGQKSRVSIPAMLKHAGLRMEKA